MNEMLEYKGYHGSIKYNKEDDILHGKVEFIRDLIAYHGKSVKEIERNFKDSVDDYLLTCKQTKKEPDQPFKGSFNIRPGVDLHRAIHLYALRNESSLNETITKAIEFFLKSQQGENITNEWTAHHGMKTDFKAQINRIENDFEPVTSVGSQSYKRDRS